MLFNDESYIKEFAEAAVESFGEFQTNFALFLRDRDETNLRKTGHKIKPVATMLGIEQIIEEYEHAKILVAENRPDSEIETTIFNMNTLCVKVIAELQQVAAGGL